MREAQISNVELARRLGVTENVVRKLLDLDHRSHIGQVEAALAKLGVRLEVVARKAA
jgi:antitoxin HicB